MPAAISCASAGGVNSSPSPTSTSVGQRIVAKLGRRSGRRMIARCWRTNASGAGILRHQPIDLLQLRIAVTVAVDEQRKQQLGYLGKAAGFARARSGDGAVRSASGVSARAPVSSSASFATRAGAWLHDLEGDVAAHRQPYRAQNAAAQRRGYGRRSRAMLSSRVWSATSHRTESPKRRDLLGVEPRRAIQSRHENGRQRLTPSDAPLSQSEAEKSCSFRLIAVQQD